jgi:hypothetical protein
LSQPLPIVGPSANAQQVRNSIARAAAATGVDFKYLLAQAKLESSLDPGARAATSSAAGLYQFTGSTWLQTLDRHGAAHGLDWADAAIKGGRVRDPAMREPIMDLRYDPDASALMAAELANDNRAALTDTLGREPDPSELYLAHFLGADGASRFLTALAADPAQSAAALMPQAAAANRGIFFAGTAPRSAGAVMELMRVKVAGAMGTSFLPTATGEVIERRDLSSSPGAAWEERPHPNPSPEVEGLNTPQRLSMSATLQATFAAAGNTAPAHVRAAYGKLQAFGL